jgi:alkanesulfonate monooxygenase SsuD/methylene tetrahydromethanopterin reductase-like flavin-dependent oxidoreductase (luciferase family)
VSGRPISIGIKTSPQNVDWPTLDAAWARIGEHDIFDSVWLNDHLTDPRELRGGSSFEAMTTIAALAHRVPGKWLGHAVLSATFRHPSVLAKQATALDHATGGRFIVGLGAGWHEGEHGPFAIPLPPMRERFDRLESTIRVLLALFSAEAATEAGVTLDDRLFPLRGATNEPPPLTPGGPPIWLGGQRPRGIRLAARFGQGWFTPAILPDGAEPTVEYFAERRSAVVAALESVERDPADFAFATQVRVGPSPAERRGALDEARRFAGAGATHLLLSMPALLGATGVDDVAREVAEPLREALG